jgi:hypothetical protein
VAQVNSYTAACHRSGRWWAIEIPEVPQGAYTQARRLGDVEHMARDLLSLMFEVPEDSFRVVVKPVLGPELDELVRRARQTRARAEDAARASADANAAVVTALLRLGLSMRETGQILGLSHQRVAQIAAAAREQGDEATVPTDAPEDRTRTARPAKPAEYPPAVSRRATRRVAER